LRLFTGNKYELQTDFPACEWGSEKLIKDIFTSETTVSKECFSTKLDNALLKLLDGLEKVRPIKLT